MEKKATITFTAYKDGTMDLAFSGQTINIITAASSFISAVYEDINKKSPVSAMTFKAAIQAIIADENSPVWNLDAEDEGEE